jgi:hypothetical protein
MSDSLKDDSDDLAADDADLYLAPANPLWVHEGGMKSQSPESQLLGGLLLEYADNLAPAMVLGVSHPAKSSRVTLSSTRLSAASSSYAADGDFHETLIVAACWRQVCRCILISNFRNLLKNKSVETKSYPPGAG